MISPRFQNPSVGMAPSSPTKRDPTYIPGGVPLLNVVPEVAKLSYWLSMLYADDTVLVVTDTPAVDSVPNTDAEMEHAELLTVGQYTPTATLDRYSVSNRQFRILMRLSVAELMHVMS